MEAAPGTAQMDTSCRNPPEPPEMPGEGSGLRGLGREGLGKCLNSSHPKNREKMTASLSELGQEEMLLKEKYE